MYKLLVTTAVASGMILTAGSAFAGNKPKYPKPTVPEPPCVECLNDAINIEQLVSGLQVAFNSISEVGDVTDVTQTALNAANLISLDGMDLGEGGVADGIGKVVQTTNASLAQQADNDLFGGTKSALENIEQAATNVVNVFSGPEVNEIVQAANSSQWANNVITFGKGGYDADALYDADDVLLPTQSALNAVNLITVGMLNGSGNQYSNSAQEAINSMTYAGGGIMPFGYGGGGYNHSIDIYDVGQTATNIANVVSATGIAGVDCGCVSVLQNAAADQYAFNDLSGSGWNTDLNNIVQNATNIANSISFLAAAD
ncbi:MAG TPA: hypothetical protein VNS12_01380 [Pelagibacterium sp.]|uniref:hypothetical protein n=1 Tax=Pelagibacterium sp. TaxID=1967288 RepID=UPI002C40191C|nr:hypothetical protein [Pelagibacterium sp.]HWJ86707.1 hypothetical protein [Pelagibacterium sp.]